MKLKDRTIPFISKVQFELFKLVLTQPETSTAGIVAQINKGIIVGPLTTITHEAIATVLNKMVHARVLLRHPKQKGVFVVKVADKTAEIVSLLEQIDLYGTDPHQNTILNTADLFLRKCSPDNRVVSGKGQFVHDSLNHAHHRLLQDTEVWMNRLQTEERHFNYQLTNECHLRVLIWRDIATLVKQIKETK